MLNSLSIEELIQYVENGVIDQVSAKDFERAVNYYREKVDHLEAEMKSLEQDYEDGYKRIISVCIANINTM